MDKDLRNKTSLHEFKKAVRAVYLTQMCWTEDAAAMHAQHNNTTNWSNLNLFLTN